MVGQEMIVTYIEDDPGKSSPLAAEQTAAGPGKFVVVCIGIDLPMESDTIGYFGTEMLSHRTFDEISYEATDQKFI